MERSLWGGAAHTEQFAHLFVQEAAAWAVRLDPLAVDHELRNGSLAYLPDQLLRGAGAGLDIDLGIGDLVFFKEPFGFTAIAAPWC